MAGIANLSGRISDGLSWGASNPIPAQQAYGQTDNVSTGYDFSTANPNNSVGGADEIVSFLQIIAPGGSVTINLQSITNILQQFGVPLARVKGYKIRLLAATGKGAVDAVNGTPCSSITFGPGVGGVSNPNNLEMNAAGTVTVNGGGSHQHFDPTAAGFMLVTGTTKNVKIVNNDGVNAAAVQVTIIGATT